MRPEHSLPKLSERRQSLPPAGQGQPSGTLRVGIMPAAGALPTKGGHRLPCPFPDTLSSPPAQLRPSYRTLTENTTVYSQQTPPPPHQSIHNKKSPDSSAIGKGQNPIG